MNSIDKQYQKLLQDILKNGATKKDRTGTGTISVFGRQIRHKMSEGFPLLTTKKMFFKGIIAEIIWFLNGDTNIKYLVDNNVHIWDGDCYKSYIKKETYNTEKTGKTWTPLTQDEFIEKIKTDTEFASKWGDLGPIYGKQWRNWNKFIYDEYDRENKSTFRVEEVQIIDQIANLINDLRTNPDSRRIMVNAWNVAELDQMSLPPCHYGFQVYTKEIHFNKRYKIGNYTPYDISGKVDFKNGLNYITQEQFEAFHHEEMTRLGIPARTISLIWNQRSVDTFLGLPFNIASYGLLLEILGKIVNMIPDELIGNLGDTHLYLNHIEQAKEQIGRKLSIDERIQLASLSPNFDPLEFGVQNKHSETYSHIVCDSYDVPKTTRDPFPLPTLIHGKTPDFYKELSTDLSLLSHLEIKDFSLINYKSHSAIKGDLSN